MVQTTVQGRPETAAPRVLTSIGRRLTPAQESRRARLVDAAYQLACEGGYAAVTIAAVCERVGVARATLYHHFGSKDHLIAEAILRWGAELERAMRESPPVKGGLLERVLATLQRVIDSAELQPNLFQAAMMTVVAADVGVDETQRELSSLVTRYLETILDSEGELDTNLLGMVLGHVLFSSLVQMAAGRRTSEEVMNDLALTTELALGRR
ncbi:MAG: TetR/AcrR family transcriptional regulator [bacterium]|nr:TetR/AcrR family transcriptional regulator [bacterium]